MINNYHIHIEGLVQGVGFRPFVFRLAKEMQLNGSVDNRNDGVFIELQSTPEDKDLFIDRLFMRKPDIAEINKLNVSSYAVKSYYTDFSIIPSRSLNDDITRISPDIAVCGQCLLDMETQQHRKDYPFINCTHCGPRFSIIKELPYDRSSTTMDVFKMCPECRSEYEEKYDRRFHAQPVACNRCGPVYTMMAGAGLSHDYHRILSLAARKIDAGEIVALKGLGGYNLVCDAGNDPAIRRLRLIKNRPYKPFAVMFADTDKLSEYVTLSEPETKVLLSWRRPIVLAGERKKLNMNLNSGLRTLGVMLPYLPVHYHLFTRLKTGCIVITSGNIGKEPIIKDNEEAFEKLAPHTGLFISHNRDIHNRVDDSVVQCNGGDIQVLRRSRGYAPEPVETDLNVDGILAFGAEQTSAFAMGKGHQAIISQYIGDIKERKTFLFFEEALRNFETLFRFTPRSLACDLHSQYNSSSLARKISQETGVPLLHIQHHHAHAVSVMAENHLKGKVLAVCLDGTGYGTDGNSWGGEFLECGYDDFVRLDHWPYAPMPGGDKAASEPWRMGIACLHQYGIGYPDRFYNRIGKQKISTVEKMIDNRINTPLSSGTGRIFDAVASLTGLCDINTYQAQASVCLEHAADNTGDARYGYDPGNPSSLHGIFRGIVSDIEAGTATGIIAAKFHRSLAGQVVSCIRSLLRKRALENVVLSGGVFQNKLLTGIIVNQLTADGIPVYMSRRVPCNDEGIALGQLCVAAHRFNFNKK